MTQLELESALNTMADAVLNLQKRVESLEQFATNVNKDLGTIKLDLAMEDERRRREREDAREKEYLTMEKGDRE